MFREKSYKFNLHIDIYNGTKIQLDLISDPNSAISVKGRIYNSFNTKKKRISHKTYPFIYIILRIILEMVHWNIFTTWFYSI